jgi:hypothetical protein
MYRRRVFGFPSPVRDREGESVHLESTRVVAQLIPKQAEERNSPGISCDAGSKIFSGQAFKAVLKHLPERTGVCEDSSDLVGEVPLAIETKVGRLLSGKLRRQELI